MKTYRIDYMHYYWITGSGWSHSETIDSWEAKAESFEVLENDMTFDLYEAECLEDYDDEHFGALADDAEGDTEIRITATELDGDGDDVETRLLKKVWLSEIIQESWRYKEITSEKAHID